MLDCSVTDERVTPPPDTTIPRAGDDGLPVRRGLPVRPAADQLLVRTGELARKQSGSGLIGGATDLYLPGRSLIRFL